MDDERFGEKLELELKPGGANITLNNENKKEYIEYVNVPTYGLQC